MERRAPQTQTLAPVAHEVQTHGHGEVEEGFGVDLQVDDEVEGVAGWGGEDHDQG